MDSERILPKEQTLEMWFREYQPEIELELDAIKKSQGDNDIILHGMEEVDPASIGNLKAVGEYLTRIVFEEDERACQTVTRALLFANQVAGMIHQEVVGYKLDDYIQEVHDSGDPQQRLDIDVRGYYLSENPSVRNILKYYAQDIDQYRGYEHLIESAGGMVFMLVERSLGEQFMREEIRNNAVNQFDNAN